MRNSEKYSSSVKVGVLTLSAIGILVFTVLWVKGRSLSGGERINLAFNDVNGIRAGSAVQMMGLRIGQIEDITPVINGKDSYVNLRFVITEKGVKIPPASQISIQQSGIIGEQFLEVTPPKPQITYYEIKKSKPDIKENTPVYMNLSEGEKEIGKIIKTEELDLSQLPYAYKQKYKSKNILKVYYIVNLPGLVIGKDSVDIQVKNNKIYLETVDGEILKTPKSDLKYTIVEPVRLSDFMDLGFRATKAMLETNDKVTEILSDDFIGDLKTSIDNIRILTANANTTLDKASLLIDSSRKDINSLINQSESLIASLTKLSDNLNHIVSDETLKNDIVSSIKSVGKMSDNINKLLEDPQTEEILLNTNETIRNMNDITSYINEFTKDEKLKEDITVTIDNLTNITSRVSELMDDYNKLEDGEKLKLKSTVKDVLTITRNVKKFSEKLNKRFLLFRLMF